LSQARKIVEKEFGAEVARALVEENPAAVLANSPLKVL
jgi:hypothetical protein